MKINLLDYKLKKLNKLNKNYFFATTILIILINLSVYIFLNDRYPFTNVYVTNTFDLSNIYNAILNSYQHYVFQHISLNMLCFVISGIYLERKYGSLCFFCLMLILSLATPFALATSVLSLIGAGFSGINYAIYGYIIVDFIFTICLLKIENQCKTEWILGIIMIALIYLAMCWNGYGDNLGFEIYPYDLINNRWHFVGFLVGIITGIIARLSMIYNKYQNNSKQI